MHEWFTHDMKGNFFCHVVLSYFFNNATNSFVIHIFVMPSHFLLRAERAIKITNVSKLYMNTLQGELDQFTKAARKFF